MTAKKTEYTDHIMLNI